MLFRSVGITRAMQKLYLTGAKMRMLYGKTDWQSESMFLDEMDKDCMDGDETVNDKVAVGSGLRGESSYTGDYFFGGHSHGTADGYAGAPASKPFDSLKASKRDTKGKENIHKEFETGDMLRHPKFGVGMLIEQDEKTMTVIFDEVGQKKLGKGFVKMEKVD